MPELEKHIIWWEDVCYNKIGAFLCHVPHYNDEMFRQNYIIFNILTDRNVASVVMNFQSWLNNTPMETRLIIWNQAWDNREKRSILLQSIKKNNQQRERDKQRFSKRHVHHLQVLSHKQY